MSFLDAKDALVELKLPWLGLTSPQETYEQLIDSLLTLDAAVANVLGRVEQRVERERQTLRGLEARIDAAARRTQQVAGSKAATVVFSAARYPAPAKQPPFERLFYDAAELERRAERQVEVPEEPPVEGFGAMAERRRNLDRLVKADAGTTGGGGGNGHGGTNGAGGGGGGAAAARRGRGARWPSTRPTSLFASSSPRTARRRR